MGREALPLSTADEKTSHLDTDFDGNKILRIKK